VAALREALNKAQAQAGQAALADPATQQQGQGQPVKAFPIFAKAKEASAAAAAAAKQGTAGPPLKKRAVAGGAGGSEQPASTARGAAGETP